MAYFHKFDVPANTLQASPVEEFVLLLQGRVTKVEIWFPPGCAGMVYLQVMDGEHQVYPREPGHYFIGDDWHIEILDVLEISSEPWGLTLRGWSPGTSYDHGVYVHFEVEPVRLITPYRVQFVEAPKGVV